MENPIPIGKPFKPGQSGNPLGRPVGIPNAATVIKKWLDVKEKIKHPVTGEEILVTQYDCIVLGQIIKARKSDTNAFNALMDRLEGKAMQRMEAEIKTESVNIEITPEQRDQILKAFKDDF